MTVLSSHLPTNARVSLPSTDKLNDTVKGLDFLLNVISSTEIHLGVKFSHHPQVKFLVQIFQLREIYKQFTKFLPLEFFEFLLSSSSSSSFSLLLSSQECFFVHFYKFLLWSPFRAIHNATCQGQASRVEERTNFLAKVRVYSFFLSFFLFFFLSFLNVSHPIEFRKEVFAQLDGIGFLSTAIT